MASSVDAKVAEPEATKPYLEALPDDPEATSVALRWAEYLGETFGASGALSALRYYESLGWITPPVRRTVTDYLCGLPSEEIHTKKYDEPVSIDPPLDRLNGSPFGAHGRSLQYVAELADDDLEVSMMLARIAEQRTG